MLIECTQVRRRLGDPWPLSGEKSQADDTCGTDWPPNLEGPFSQGKVVSPSGRMSALPWFWSIFLPHLLQCFSISLSPEMHQFESQLVMCLEIWVSPTSGRWRISQRLHNTGRSECTSPARVQRSAVLCPVMMFPLLHSKGEGGNYGLCTGHCLWFDFETI